MKTKVLIVEPSEVIAAGLVAVLSDVTRFQVLKPLTSIEDLPARLVSAHPDVVVINATLAEKLPDVTDGQSVAVVALVYQYVEQRKLRQFSHVIDIRESRGAIVETLIDAVSTHAPSENKSASNYELSKRETAVLVLVAKGLTNKEIADQLNVSPHTVMSHRKNIVHKTGIKSVAGLTVYAMLNNLIDESALI